jgi:tetratricopeptide (TPR) repeat protein
MTTNTEYQVIRRPSDNLAPVQAEPPVSEPQPASQHKPAKRYTSLVFRPLLLLTVLLPIVSLNQGESVQFKRLSAEGLTAPATAMQDPLTSTLVYTELQPEPKRRQSIAPVQPKLSKVDRLLGLAYERMDSLRLSYPKGDSALKYFRDILDLEPDNIAAQAGIRQIVRWYVRKADEALEQGDKERARTFIQRGLMIDDRHPKLLALQRRAETGPSTDKQSYGLLRLLQD